MTKRIAYVTGGMGGIGTSISQRLHKERLYGRRRLWPELSAPCQMARGTEGAWVRFHRI